MSATCSHLAATCSGSHLAATCCSHLLQPLRASVCEWLPSGCLSKWLQVAAKWLPEQVAAKWPPSGCSCLQRIVTICSYVPSWGGKKSVFVDFPFFQDCRKRANVGPWSLATLKNGHLWPWNSRSLVTLKNGHLRPYSFKNSHPPCVPPCNCLHYTIVSILFLHLNFPSAI